MTEAPTRFPAPTSVSIPSHSSTILSRTGRRCWPSRNFARKPSARSSDTSSKSSIPTSRAEFRLKNWGSLSTTTSSATLAGVPESGRPLFLKIVYHGPRAMEELAQYDPNLVVGILGGSAGTTYDAFRLIHDAQKYGARVALFGRKINNAEHQLAFIEMLRLITEGKINPEEAVRAYHGILQAKKIKPKLPLEKDLELTDQAMSYDGSAARASVSVQNNPLAPRIKSSPAPPSPAAATSPAAQTRSNPGWPLSPPAVRILTRWMLSSAPPITEHG